MIVAFKLFLIVALTLVARIYLRHARSILRDRLIILALFVGLLAAIVQPALTTAIARWLGIGRGADLASYLAFILVFFLVGVLYARHQETQRAMTHVVREMALLQARRPKPKRSANNRMREPHQRKPANEH